MNKYIPAEKLIVEIERRKDVHRKNYEEFKDERFINDECEDDRILVLIDALQKQPFPRWIHANYSDKPEIRHTPSGTPYLQNGPYMIWLSDLETLPKDGTDLTNPGPMRMAEEDLEKDVEHWRNMMPVIIGKKWLSRFARHFWNKGYNARGK